MKPLENDDAVKAFHANLKRVQLLVQTKDGSIVIADPLDPYDIPLDRCKTDREALDWLIHIADKNWATVEILQRFACHAKAHVDSLGHPPG